MISGERWVFDTYEELQRKFFPFWSVPTIKRTILDLEKKGWIVSCQPEGAVSRRKYYRLSAQCYLHLTSERYRESVESRMYQNDPLSGSNRPLPLTETSTETPEQENPHPFSERVGVAPEKPKSAKPTWPQVVAEGNRLALPAATIRRFWLVNEHYGWTVRGRPLKFWKRALEVFAEEDKQRGEQKRDAMTSDEFWAWAKAEFGEDTDDYEDVRAWVRIFNKNGGKKRNKITGDMEPVSDFRAACRAFVEECREMGISR